MGIQGNNASIVNFVHLWQKLTSQSRPVTLKGTGPPAKFTGHWPVLTETLQYDAYRVHK